MPWGNNDQKTRWRRATGSPGHRTAPKRNWTEAEDSAVLLHAVPDRDLAKQIGRSVTAIQCRRSRLRNKEG